MVNARQNVGSGIAAIEPLIIDPVIMPAYYNFVVRLNRRGKHNRIIRNDAVVEILVRRHEYDVTVTIGVKVGVPGIGDFIGSSVY